MTQALIDWQKITDLTGWDGKDFSFELLINNALETIHVFKKRYVTVVFADSKSISIGVNNRNPFTKFDRAAYIDDDGWLWVGNVYEG